MRIGIDCRTVLDPDRGEGAGIGHYVDALVRALIEEGRGHEFTLFFDRHAVPALRKEMEARPGVEVRTFPFHSIFGRIPVVQSHMVVSALFARARLDVLHGPANSTPLFYRGRTVVTVHDLAVYAHPEWFPSAFPGLRSFSTRLVVPSSIARAARVIAVSESTKRDIIATFGTDAGKIDVVHEGADHVARAGFMDSPGHDDVLRRLGLKKGGYLLMLGTIEPRKNVARAVRAFVRAVRSGDPIVRASRLVIAGRRGWKYGAAVAAVGEANRILEEETGVRDAVVMTGYIDARERSALLSHASALLFPSLYEGFGLPALEAMAAGTPVITSDRSSLPEIVGDAALLIDPESEGAMAEAIVRIGSESGLSAWLRENGAVRAAHFSWGAAARGTLETYRRAVSQA